MTVISNEYAAELIAKMRAEIEARDPLTADIPTPDDERLLIIKLYDDLQAMRKATAYLGTGIKPVTKVEG